MSEQFREQINTARRRGYSDDEIVDFLKQSDNRVNEALSSGYKSNEILDFLAPKPSIGEEAVRKAGIVGRSASEAMIGPATGALMGAPFGPVGAAVGGLVGGLAIPAADVIVQGYNRLADSNLRMPSQVISNFLPGPRPESSGERVLGAATNALVGTGSSVATGRGAMAMPGMFGAAGREAARAPVGQVITAPVSAATAQGVTEATDSPLAGLLAGTAVSGAAGLRPTKRESTPSTEQLKAQSDAAYDVLDKSGFQFFRKEFNQHMDTLPSKLRSEVGYAEGLSPKIDAVMAQLKSDRPKDIVELQALRKVIGGAAKSPDPQERLVANSVLDEFDDYLLNAPNKALIVRDPAALEAWKIAKSDYAKMKKSELITDIIERAEVSQGNKERNMASQLSALAKNEKKMRFFTPDEQEAIKTAAKGGATQKILQILGKFTPTTPASTVFTVVSPFGAYTAGAGYAAQGLSTVRREQEINRLANQMRLGARPKVIEGAGANVPVFAGRGALNALYSGNENSLAP
jgi:hypothetical protein